LKIILIILSLAATIPACKPKSSINQAERNTPTQTDTGYYPKPIGYVNDYVHLYTPDQARTLDSLIQVYEKRTTIEIAVVTLDSTMVGRQDFDEYTLKLAKHWGVGKKETNNGVFIAIAPYLRRIRINNGKGIEPIFSASETKAIIDSIFVPNFKNGKFYEGTQQALIAIMKKLS
jgi:uncharacterized protein